ncbi:hypothetical protein BGZ65_000368, partial [Modicella reniformis]
SDPQQQQQQQQQQQHYQQYQQASYSHGYDMGSHTRYDAGYQPATSDQAHAMFTRPDQDGTAQRYSLPAFPQGVPRADSDPSSTLQSY